MNEIICAHRATFHEVEILVQLRKKELYEITVDNLAPPYEDYEFFKDCDQLPFRYQANIFDMVNAWWLIDAATLVYSEPEFVTEKFQKNAGFAEVKFFEDKATQSLVRQKRASLKCFLSPSSITSRQFMRSTSGTIFRKSANGNLN